MKKFGDETSIDESVLDDQNGSLTDVNPESIEKAKKEATQYIEDLLGRVLGNSSQILSYEDFVKGALDEYAERNDGNTNSTVTKLAVNKLKEDYSTGAQKPTEEPLVMIDFSNIDWSNPESWMEMVKNMQKLFYQASFMHIPSIVYINFNINSIEDAGNLILLKEALSTVASVEISVSFGANISADEKTAISAMLASARNYCTT